MILLVTTLELLQRVIMPLLCFTGIRPGCFLWPQAQVQLRYLPEMLFLNTPCPMASAWLCSGLGSTDGHLKMPANGNFVMWALCPQGFGHMLFVFKSTEKSAAVATPLHNR